MVSRHDGSDASDGHALVVPASPSIGMVISADTNVPVGDGALGRFFRGLGGGSFTSYVGDAGAQRSVMGAFGAAKETLVSFADADRMCVERTRVHQGRTYQHTSVILHFRRAPADLQNLTAEDDEPIATFETKYYADGTAPLEEPIQFLNAVERTWNAYIEPRVLAAFRDTGVVEFRSTGRYRVRVSRDELSCGSPGKVLRTRPRSELQEIWIDNGRVLASPPLGNHPEIARSSIGNFQMLLRVLSLAGYPVQTPK